MPDVSRCSQLKCGRPIIWAKSPTGANIPLDARPAVMYYLDDDKPPNAVPVTAAIIKPSAGLFGSAFPQEVEPKIYVSHWLTCIDPPGKK